MANITIQDLRVDRTLDRRALSLIRGAGAPWVFGWIRPYMNALPSQVPVVNFYQINNFAEQMINQYQVVSVINSGPASNLSVSVDESSVNNRLA
jgi:hypothetical protein